MWLIPFVIIAMGPFYLALCRDFHRDVDQALANEFKKTNTTKVQVRGHDLAHAGYIYNYNYVK